GTVGKRVSPSLDGMVGGGVVAARPARGSASDAAALSAAGSRHSIGVAAVSRLVVYLAVAGDFQPTALDRGDSSSHPGTVLVLDAPVGGSRGTLRLLDARPANPGSIVRADRAPCCLWGGGEAQSTYHHARHVRHAGPENCCDPCGRRRHGGRIFA